MPHEVKMPQLGMTQDSGVIVSWQKFTGDAVAAGDVLFEVETDKATMEVEAPVEGYLSDVRAKEGDDVPVGDVIALIVENADAVTESASPKQDDQTPQDPISEPEQSTPEAETVPVPDADQAHSPPPMPQATRPVSTGGKVLASPKARRLAMERGIDLATLRASGVSEPIHAADLSKAPMGGQSIFTAEVEGKALIELLKHSSDETDRTRILAGFSRRSWETRFDCDPVAVKIRSLDGTEKIEGRENDPVVLVLVDLCDSNLSGYAPASGTTLTVAQGASGFKLTLGFAEPTLPFSAAASLLNDIAARIDDPIRQLI